MLAQLTEKLPAGPDWSYEVKLDGIRAIAVKHARKVQLFSRTPRDITAEYPRIVEALRHLPVADLVLDGEIMALDAEGRSSFQLLQNRKRRPDALPIFYVVFDVLHAAGDDVTKRSLGTRRKLLEEILPHPRAPLRRSPVLEGEPARIWAEVQRLGLEGLVAKRKDSHYDSGRRSGAWRKIKAQQQQEFVIGGYTEPRGTRKHFGAVLVGYYAQRQLRFAAAVGTGFDTATLRSLYQRLQEYRTPHCPFANLPATRHNRWGGGLTATEMRRCTWLQPELVCMVKFYEWTRDGNLRQPVFLGLRADKPPRQVRREQPLEVSGENQPSRK